MDFDAMFESLRPPPPQRVPCIEGYTIDEDNDYSTNRNSIYKATNRERATVILKSPRPDGLGFEKRFEVERKALGLCKGSEHVVEIHGTVEDHTNRRFLVLEWLNGITLAERGARARITNRERTKAIKWIFEAALALQTIYKKGIVHRDVKPANLILDFVNDKIKLIDFELALLKTAPDSSIDGHIHPSFAVETPSSPLFSHNGVGTPGYQAPEQQKDPSKADIRSDIFSLGCTAFYLFTGTLPGEFVNDREGMKSYLRAQSELTPDDPLFSLIIRMTEPKPADRYQTPKELSEALNALLTAEPSPSEEHSSVPQPRSSKPDSRSEDLRLRRRTIPRLVTVCIPILLIVGISFFALRPEDKRAPVDSRERQDVRASTPPGGPPASPVPGISGPSGLPDAVPFGMSAIGSPRASGNKWILEKKTPKHVSKTGDKQLENVFRELDYALGEDAFQFSNVLNLVMFGVDHTIKVTAAIGNWEPKERSITFRALTYRNNAKLDGQMIVLAEDVSQSPTKWTPVSSKWDEQKKPDPRDGLTIIEYKLDPSSLKLSPPQKFCILVVAQYPVRTDEPRLPWFGIAHRLLRPGGECTYWWGSQSPGFTIEPEIYLIEANGYGYQNMVMIRQDRDNLANDQKAAAARITNFWLAIQDRDGWRAASKRTGPDLTNAMINCFKQVGYHSQPHNAFTFDEKDFACLSSQHQHLSAKSSNLVVFVEHANAK